MRSIKKFFLALSLVLCLCFFAAAFSACGNSALEELRRQVEGLQQRVTELENENGQLKDRVEELEDENGRLKDKIAGLEEKINMPTEWAIEFGFNFNERRNYESSTRNAFRAEKTEYALDKAEIYLFYGFHPHYTIPSGNAVIEYMQKDGARTPIKEIANFYNGDYAFEWIETGEEYPENARFKFKHYEKLIIPRELFTEANGQVSILITGYPDAPPPNVNRPSHVEFLNVYYLLDGETVTLSDTPFPMVLESGFLYTFPEQTSIQDTTGKGAYRADKTEFDLNDVVLEFFYGTQDTRILERTEKIEILSHGENLEIFTLKDIEDFYNGNYICAVYGQPPRVDFMRSEMIQIPRAVFSQSAGRIDLKISNGNISLYYQMNGEKVTLATDPFDGVSY